MVVSVPLYAADSKLIIDFIRRLGWDETEETGYPLHEGSYILESPDRIVFITGTGGPGYTTEEGATDAISFQLRLRGAPEEPFEPDSRVRQLDRAILSAPFPMVIDGLRIHSISRAGSPPAPLPVDPRDLRHEFTCSYVMIRQGS